MKDKTEENKATFSLKTANQRLRQSKKIVHTIVTGSTIDHGSYKLSLMQLKVIAESFVDLQYLIDLVDYLGEKASMKAAILSGYDKYKTHLDIIRNELTEKEKKIELLEIQLKNLKNPE